MDQDTNSDKTSKKDIKKLHLGNLQGVKKSLARLINESLKPESDLTRIRCAIYGMNCLVSAYKLDNDERLNEIERLLNEQKIGKN